MLAHLSKTNVALLRTLKDAHRFSSRTKNANAAKAANAFPNKSYVRIDEKFYPKERQRIRKIEAEMDEAIDFHEEQIKVHQTAIGYIKKKTPYVCTKYKI